MDCFGWLRMARSPDVLACECGECCECCVEARSPDVLPCPPQEAEALQRAVPTQRRPFASRCVSDAAGVPVRVEVRAEDAGQGEDTWLELADPLELEVLERVVPGASASAARLATDLAAESEGSVTEEDVIERLRHLYELRLISMDLE